MRLLAWALYDLANTFFAVAMLSFYFPLWVIEDRGAKELVFSGTLAASMVCVAVAMPLCGAVSDARAERMRYLRWTTFGCVSATVLIGLLDELWLALVLFAFANFCYQLGTVFYDALLWQLARPGRLGQASGFGAAFGYLGSMTGLLFLWPFVKSGGHQAAFIPSAVFFLLFALPIFLVILEPMARAPIAWRSTIHTALRRLVTTVRSARSLTGLWRFFIASFFSLNAINTVLIFMAVYTKTVLGFSESELIRFFLWGQAFAILGSLVFGRVVGWLGSKQTLALIWTGWMMALLLVSLSQDARWLWTIGPLIGFCLGSTWATSRVLLVELAPKDQLAELLGLAGLLSRASSILGPVLWGLIVLDPTRYRQALLALVGLLGIGLILFQRVPDPRRLQP